MQLNLIPIASGIGGGAAAITNNRSVAHLDLGFDKNPGASVSNGTAKWTDVTAFAWPGVYYLEIGYSPASNMSFVQVSQRVRH